MSERLIEEFNRTMEICELQDVHLNIDSAGHVYPGKNCGTAVEAVFPRRGIIQIAFDIKFSGKEINEHKGKERVLVRQKVRDALLSHIQFCLKRLDKMKKDRS